MTQEKGGDAGDDTLTDFLSAASKAAESGDHERAYQLGLQVIEHDPDNSKAWLLCAEYAPSIEESIACLNRANTVMPLDGDVRKTTYRTLQNLLKQEPFLLYLDETDEVYHIRSGMELPVVVPKDRSIPEAYPARRPYWLQKAYYWLWISFLGLPFAGLGAIVFAPFAAFASIRLYILNPSKANRIHSLVILLVSGSLWLVGLLLGLILFVHLS